MSKVASGLNTQYGSVKTTVTLPPAGSGGVVATALYGAPLDWSVDGSMSRAIDTGAAPGPRLRITASIRLPPFTKVGRKTVSTTRSGRSQPPREIDRRPGTRSISSAVTV